MAIAHILPGRKVLTPWIVPGIMPLTAWFAATARNVKRYQPSIEKPEVTIRKSVIATLEECAKAYDRGDEFCVLADVICFFGKVDTDQLASLVVTYAGPSLAELTIGRGLLPAETVVHYYVEPPQLHNPPHA